MTAAASPLPPLAVPPPMPLALGDYAAVAAHLVHAADRPAADVLEELGVDAGVWRASIATWERAVDDELARGEHALLVAFTASFAAARAVLGRAAAPAAPAVLAAPAAGDCGSMGLEAAMPSALLVPEVPDVPIGPDTVRLEGRPEARPLLPFAPSDPTPETNDEDEDTDPWIARAALPVMQIEPSLPIEATTARVDLAGPVQIAGDLQVSGTVNGKRL